MKPVRTTGTVKAWVGDDDVYSRITHRRRGHYEQETHGEPVHKCRIQVTVTDSAAGVLYGILKKTAQVILLSTRFDELLATEFIPILKKCNRNLNIILIASELPLALIRKARSEGIFYHALKSSQPSDEAELQQAVKCAFAKATHVPVA